MRFIRKREAPARLCARHANPPSTSKEAKAAWDNFHHKGGITDFLLAEQYGLCAYTEVRPEDHGLGSHIDHLQPRALYPTRTFDYLNLVVSILSSEDLHRIPHDQVFGGHAKQENYDEGLFVSPLQTDCAAHFIYLSDGRVVPNRLHHHGAQNRANYTIDLLNLNSPYLVNLRKRWMDELDAEIQRLLVDSEALKQLADCELEPTNRKLRSFHTASRQRLGSVAENIIQAHYPELA